MVTLNIIAESLYLELKHNGQKWHVQKREKALRRNYKLAAVWSKIIRAQMSIRVFGKYLYSKQFRIFKYKDAIVTPMCTTCKNNCPMLDHTQVN